MRVPLGCVKTKQRHLLLAIDNRAIWRFRHFADSTLNSYLEDTLGSTATFSRLLIMVSTYSE